MAEIEGDIEKWQFLKMNLRMTAFEVKCLIFELLMDFSALNEAS